MAVQTVVIDVFQTNKKLKEFDKNIDRLGKSFEKMRKQMERFNQDKRSTGLSLSQGDMFSKAVDKMTNTMTKLFSNGIKINNLTVNTKVTVDFAKMDIAGQMGSALKNADIAGTILRNLRLPKMGISNASAFKVDIPNKMQVEITNKELQVKLPKEPSQGKNTGFFTRTRERYNNFKSTNVNNEYKKGSFEKGLDEKVENITKNWDTIKGIPKDLMGLKNLPKIFSPVEDLFKGFFKGSVSNFSKISSVNGLAKAIPLAKGVGLGAAGIGMSVFTSGFTIFSVALKGLTGIIKGAAGIIKGVVGIFQNIASVLSSVWGQVQKWAVNPLVDAQNQMSQNKGYWNVLGGQEAAEDLDNKIGDLAVKGPYEYDSVEGAVRKLVDTGMNQEEALGIAWDFSNMASAKSLDENGFMQGIDSYIQMTSSQYPTVDDFNSMANVSDPATLAKHLLKVEKAGAEEIEKAKQLMSEGNVSKKEFIEAVRKSGQDAIGLSKKFAPEGTEGYESIAEEVASTTYKGVTTKIKNIFQVDIVKKWGTGLSDGLAEGLGKFASWLDENRETFSKWGDQLKQIGVEIGNYITNFLQSTGERMKGVFASEEFQQADLSGKIVIFWDEVIKKPFSDWWGSTGKSFFEESFENLGETTGGILSGIINGFLGSNPTDAVGEGYNLGFKFAEGFMKGFDLGEVLKNIGKTLLKVAWDFSLGLIINPIWNGFHEDGNRKVVENSDYKDIEPYTKEGKKSLKNVQEMEYDRSSIRSIKEKNKETDGLMKTVNDLTWEYNELERQRKEALEAGDEDTAIKKQEEMRIAQEKLNDAQSRLESMYPGLINFEQQSLDKIKEKVKAQQEYNELVREELINNLKAQVATPEGKQKVQEHIEKAFEDRNKLYESEQSLAEYEGKKERIQELVTEYVSDAQTRDSDYASVDDKNKAILDITGYQRELMPLFKEFLVNGEGMDVQKLETLISTYGESPDGLGKIMNEVTEILDKKTEKEKENIEKLKQNVIDSTAQVEEDTAVITELGILETENKTGLDRDEIIEKWGTGAVGDTNKKIIDTKITEIESMYQVLEALGIEMKDEHKNVYIHVRTIEEKTTTEGVTTEQSDTIETEDSKDGTFKVAGNVGGNAKGNILMSPQLSWVAEAGPEAIIPLTGPYKSRGISLWEQAGQMLGVTPKYAKGGIVGSYEIPRQTPHLYQQIEEASEESESAGGQISQIDIGGVYLGGVNFTFNGTEANSREGIMKVIKEQMPDIADEIAGTIAVNIQRIFANMQLQTG